MSHQADQSPRTKSIKTLNIFDFDGTLFRSPSPNPKYWDDGLLSSFRKPTEFGGLGWWQDVFSLSPPFVPNDPGSEWFVETVLKKVKRSTKNKKAVTVLLTGRPEAFTDRIKHILSDLKFDEFGFNTGNKNTTTFKCSYITSLVKKYNPKKINIFEDNAEQFETIHSFLDEMYRHTLKVKGIVSESKYTFLPYSQERDLIDNLNKKIKTPLKWSEYILYTCVLLDDDSRNELIRQFPANENWTRYYEHLTICLGDRKTFKKGNIPRDPVGTDVTLTVQSFGGNEKAYAVTVTGYYSKNEVPHITCFVAPGCKPVDSKTITNFIPVPEFQISGKITEVKFGKIHQNVDAKKPAFPPVTSKFKKRKSLKNSSDEGEQEVQQFFKTKSKKRKFKHFDSSEDLEDSKSNKKGSKSNKKNFERKKKDSYEDSEDSESKEKISERKEKDSSSSDEEEEEQNEVVKPNQSFGFGFRRNSNQMFQSNMTREGKGNQNQKERKSIPVQAFGSNKNNGRTNQSHNEGKSLPVQAFGYNRKSSQSSFTKEGQNQKESEKKRNGERSKSETESKKHKEKSKKDKESRGETESERHGKKRSKKERSGASSESTTPKKKKTKK